MVSGLFFAFKKSKLAFRNWNYEKRGCFFAAASEFSEILWLKRDKPTILFNAPPEYIANIKYYNLPYFNLNKKCQNEKY